MGGINLEDEKSRRLNASGFFILVQIQGGDIRVNKLFTLVYKGGEKPCLQTELTGKKQKKITS